MADSILHDIAAGKSGGIDACLRRYSPVVWRLARRVTGSDHDAEDAVQEIFLEVWRSAERFDPRAGSEFTFVLTIARRRLIDRARRRGRVPVPGEDELLDAVAAETTADLSGAELGDETARVAAAMAQLRPEQRSVLEMSFLAGRTHHQISAETGMPLGTVKTHARRGLRRVRELLGIDPDVAARTAPLPTDPNDSTDRP